MARDAGGAAPLRQSPVDSNVVMPIILLIVIVLPLYKVISTLALHGREIMTAIKALPSYALPPPPGSSVWTAWWKPWQRKSTFGRFSS